MNLSLPSVVLFMVGAVLVYSAIQNDDPRDTLRIAFGKKDHKYGPLDGDTSSGYGIGGPLTVAPSNTPTQGLGQASGIPVVSV